MKRIMLDDCKDKINYLYHKERLSLKKVAKKVGVSATTIRKNMLKWDMPRRKGRRIDIIIPKKKELEELYINKKMTLDKIASILGVSASSVLKWIRRYKIPVRRYKYEKFIFSGNQREKAYILGLVAGDLHARRQHRLIYTELTTTHPAMTDLFYGVFEKYALVKKYFKYSKKINRYEWKSWVLLDNSFEFMLSKEFNINNDFFHDFLAGFFDCEGTLHVYNNHGYIGLSFHLYNSNKGLLEIIKSRLEKDGFHPKLSRFFKKGEETGDGYCIKKDLWAVRLHTKQEVLSLISILPIRHKEKISKLKIVKNLDKNMMWGDISNQVDDLKLTIKKDVKKYVNPINLTK